MTSLSNDRPAPDRSRAVMALTGACAMWGLGFPLVKAFALSATVAAPGVSSWFVAAFMLFVRFAVAALVLVALTRAWPAASEWKQGLALAVITGLGMLLQTDALAYTAASTAAFLTQGYVVLLPLIGVARTRRLPPLRVSVCATLVLVGLAILSHFDPGALRLGRGEAETLGAAAFFTVQILLVDARTFSANRTALVTLVMFAGIAAVVLPFAVVASRGGTDVAPVVGAPGSVTYLVVTTLLPTLGSFLLMNRFQRRVTANEAGIVYAIEPVFASAFALVLPAWLSRFSRVYYPNEHLEPRLLLGGVLVVGANLVLALGERRAPPSAAKSPNA
jgi:drug/metabolite transporter (DMT)-like permease